MKRLYHVTLPSVGHLMPRAPRNITFWIGFCAVRRPEVAMSALGQKRTLRRICVMSALPPKADIRCHRQDVRFVPKADSCTATILSLFDHLVGSGKHRLQN